MKGRILEFLFFGIIPYSSPNLAYDVGGYFIRKELGKGHSLLFKLRNLDIRRREEDKGTSSFLVHHIFIYEFGL